MAFQIRNRDAWKPKPRKPKKPRKWPYKPRDSEVLYFSTSPCRPNSLTVTMSRDVVDKLVETYEKRFGALANWLKDPEGRYDLLRIKFIRFTDYSMASVFMCLEPPTFNPVGNRLKRLSGNRYYATVVPRKLGLKPGVNLKNLDFEFVESMGAWTGGGGCVIFYPEEAADFHLPEQDPNENRGRAAAGDLYAHPEDRTKYDP